MAIFGLLISSSALVIIQGVMGGLQNGLIKRSKNVIGSYWLHISDSSDPMIANALIDDLQKLNLPFTRGLEIELLFKKGEYIYPVILSGLDFKNGAPNFLKEKDQSGIILGAELASRLNAYLDSEIEIISPLHTSSVMGEIPRYVSDEVSDFFLSDLPEIDGAHAWVRLSLVQNLIRERRINSIRIYQDNASGLEELIANKYSSEVTLKTWEDMNQTLVWALRLETSMMLFLFISMTALVSISITSGFMIFFDKVKTDLISFWILGKSQEDLYRLTGRFTYFLSGLFAVIGVVLGVGVLLFLKYNELKIFPSFFVEQRIPVNISKFSIVISFLVPFLVASVFARFAFSIFRKEHNSFISLIRKVG